MENLVNNFNRTLAKQFAFNVAHLWNCPSVVKSYLNGPINSEESREAAYSAAKAEYDALSLRVKENTPEFNAARAALFACYYKSDTRIVRRDVEERAALAVAMRYKNEKDRESAYISHRFEQNQIAAQTWKYLLNDVL
jgi:hypothetical protein